MEFIIYDPQSILPNMDSCRLVEARVKEVFCEIFEQFQNDYWNIHHAFLNRYFLVFPSLQDAKIFCIQKLWKWNIPKKELPRIQFRWLVEDTHSWHTFCVINIAFPPKQSIKQSLWILQKNFFLS